MSPEVNQYKSSYSFIDENKKPKKAFNSRLPRKHN